MKILITGICGFAGSHLAAALSERIENASIVGIDNLLRAGIGSVQPNYACRRPRRSVYYTATCGCAATSTPCPIAIGLWMRRQIRVCSPEWMDARARASWGNTTSMAP